MNHYKYKIHDLVISSHIQSKYLPQTQDTNAQVQITYGDIPNLENSLVGMRTQTAAMKFILHIDGIGKFFVCDGNKIIVAPRKGVSDKELMLFLLGTPWAILLLQRGLLPLNGSSVVVNDYAVTFVGNSSSGKSSVALALQQKGYQVVNDEISAVDNTSFPCVHPGINYIQTWSATLKLLDKLQKHYPKVRDCLEKYYVPITKPVSKPIPLRKVYILASQNKQGYNLQQIEGVNKFMAIKNHIWGQPFCSPLNIQAVNFKAISSLTQKVLLKKFEYPWNCSYNEMMDFLEKDLAE